MKAIAAVSFGSTHADAREEIALIEADLAASMPEREQFRAFTSSMIIRKLQAEEGISIPNPAQLLTELLECGYKDVICQSLHVISGIEYDKLCAQIGEFKPKFRALKIGAPLLGSETDLADCAAALAKHIPALREDEAYILMGHGTEHAADSAYSCLEQQFWRIGLEHVFIATVEGSRKLENVKAELEPAGIRRVTLAPLMIVAGEHAKNDLAEGWADDLKESGYSVNCVLRGIAGYAEIRKIFVNHAIIAADL